MEKGLIHIYMGDGRGKSPAALGRAVQAAAAGQSVVIIQFLKGKGKELGNWDFLRKMEPEIKVFRFEKSGGNFALLSEEKKQEEISNIKNGINYAKKVLTTGECDLLILDEVLGVVENGILSVEELKALLECREETGVILTGINLSDEVRVLADEVSRIEAIKVK